MTQLDIDDEIRLCLSIGPEKDLEDIGLAAFLSVAGREKCHISTWHAA